MFSNLQRFRRLCEKLQITMALGLVFLVGCEESTKDAMMRVARQRAAAKEAQEKEDAELAAKQAAAAPTTAEPPAAPVEGAQPPAAAPATPAATNNIAAALPPTSPATTPASPEASKPATAAAAPAPSISPPATASIAAVPSSNYVLPADLLRFDVSGKLVAYSGEGTSLGVHDVDAKALVRKAYNDQLSPSCLAIDEKGTQLVVGGADGRMKTFSLGSVRGLDRYAQERLERRDREPPRKAHSQAITAIAASNQAKLISTGDLTGELRIWSTGLSDEFNYNGGQGGFVDLFSVQSGQKPALIFGITKQKKLLYWESGQKAIEPIEFAASSDMPTVMRVGPKNRGMAFGDDTGRVTLWLPDGSELKKQSFQAHSNAVSGIAFTNSGDAMVTASRTGELLQWSLPLKNSQTFELAEPARFLSVSNNGRVMGVPSRKKFLDVYSAGSNTKLRSYPLPVDRRVMASAFSNDNRVTVVGDDDGTLHFYGSLDQPFASYKAGATGIEHMEMAPSEDLLAAVSKDGLVSVIGLPSNEVTFARTSPVDVAVADESGTKMLVASNNGLQVIACDTASATRSVAYGGAPVTAGYIDATVALLGTNKGEVYRWIYNQEGASPEQLKLSSTGSALTSVGITKDGQVWTCDTAGKCKLVEIAKQSDQVAGSFKQAISKVELTSNGRLLLLGSDGTLSTAQSLSEEPARFTQAEVPKFADFRSSPTAVYGLASDQLSVLRFDNEGKRLGRVSIGSGHGGIVKFDGGDRSYALLTKSGRMLAGANAQDVGPSQVLASGHLQNAKIALDGSTVIGETPEGMLYVGSNSTRSQKISLPKPVHLLAIAPDAQTLIVVEGERADCVQLQGDRARVLFVLPAEAKVPSAACFTSDSRTIFLASSDGGLYKVTRNDPSKATLLAKVGGTPTAIQSNASGDRLFVQSQDGRVLLLSVQGEAGTILYDSEGQKFSCIATSGARYLAGDATGVVYEVQENPPGKRELIKLADSAIVGLNVEQSGERCVAETSDKQLHQINLKDAVWYSSQLPNEGNGLALSLRGSTLTRVDTLGNLQVSPVSMGIALLGPESNVQHVATSADGNWVAAIDARGKLARWPVSVDGIGKPLRVSSNLLVDDLQAFPSGSLICLLSKEKGLASYDVEQDRIVASITGKTGASSIHATGFDQTVVIQKDGKFLIGDFRGSRIEELGTTEDSQLVQVAAGRGRAWLTVAKSGEYKSSPQQGKGDGPTEFQVGAAVSASRQRSGMLLARNQDAVIAVRSDGTQLAPFKVPAGKVVAAAMGTNSTVAAVCDSNGKVWIQGGANAAPRSATLPDAAITDVAWNATDSRVAVATGKGIYVIDALTTAVESFGQSSTPIQAIVAWGENEVWCVGTDRRLFKLRIASVAWSKKLSSPSTILAWHAEGKEVVCGDAAGTLQAWDAETGQQVARTSCGKSDLRACCAVNASGKLLLLAGTSSIIGFDRGHRVSEIPISSALQLVSIATDTSGRWLYASNNVGEILVWDLTNREAAPKTIPAESRSTHIRFVEGAKLASVSNSQPLLALSAATAFRNSIANMSGTIEDFVVLPDDSYIAVADGSSVIRLVSLAAKESQQLSGNSVGFRKIAMHPRGVRVAAAGQVLGKSEAKLALWDMVDLKLIGEAELPSIPLSVRYSPDGNLMVVALEDGACMVFNGANGSLLESFPAVPGLNIAEFSADGRRILLAKQDGTITEQALTAFGVAKVSDTAITSVSFHGAGKYIFISDAVGRISLRPVSGLDQPQVVFQGINAPLLQVKLSPNGKALLAVYDDTDHSVFVWKLDGNSGIPASSAPDTIIRSPESRNTCASFTIDSQYILIGAEDGLIRAWSVQETREVAKFRGHTGAVRDIAPYSEAGRFVSGAADHSIKTWRFPGNLPRSGDPIPEGALVDGTDMKPVTIPQSTANEEDDRFAAARDVLIAGNPNDEQIGQIFDLVSKDRSAVADAKASLAKLRAVERDPQASLNDVYEARQRNSQLRRRLLGKDSDFSRRFGNVNLEASTNFRFGTGENSRPVKLRFADRFLYAARPSVPKRPPNPDEPPPDLGDNGAILSWDLLVTGMPSREWLADEIDVRELFSFPANSSIMTVPSTTLFSQDDGASLQLPYATSWEVSRAAAGGRQLFAVGSSGANRKESVILTVYDVAEVTRSEKVKPLSTYTSYEGIVTAMAFSNTSSQIAFCVRERAVHRLYIAEAEKLEDPTAFKLVQEYAHKLPWFTEEGDRGAPGITSLAFTSDDQALVAHGRYEEELYKLSAWKISRDPQDSRLIEMEQTLERKNDQPFVAERSSRPIRFVNHAGSEILVAEGANAYTVWNIKTGEAHQIPFLPMQRGLPERSLSEDGRWLIMGDDRGYVFVYDVLSVLRGGEVKKYSVAFTKATEKVEPSTIREKNPRGAPKAQIKVADPPAHSGPVVGVALSPPSSKSDFPEFASSIGEENRVIVWDLIPVLANRPQQASQPSKRTATR